VDVERRQRIEGVVDQGWRTSRRCPEPELRIVERALKYTARGINARRASRAYLALGRSADGRYWADSNAAQRRRVSARLGCTCNRLGSLLWRDNGQMTTQGTLGNFSKAWLHAERSSGAAHCSERSSFSCGDAYDR
jgi:hypothetical protein